jgi:dinuclear metal center YbgI/SA1388 family protein
MTSIHEIAAYLDSFLDTGSTPDYPSALNGLQLENQSEIRGIAAAVDFSNRAIDGAVDSGANLLIVHHGMFWGGLGAVTGPTYHKLRKLLQHDISVYSSHLPLDRHPVVGNNVLLAGVLGLESSAPFARFENVHIGVRGECDIDTHTIIGRADEFARKHGGSVRASLTPAARRTRRWAICTGGGASAETLRECEELRVDTLIVGEGPHWTAVHAEEHDLAIIYAGHYATETLGVRALAAHLGERCGLPFSFVSAPTGL